MLDRENAATREFRDLGEQRRSVQLLRGAIAITKRVENADGIELGVRLFDQPLDVVLVVPTMIIPSIGKNQQGTLGVTCTPHLTEAKIDGVEQGGAAMRRSNHHAGLQVFDAVGESTGQLRALVKGDQEKFILGVGGLEELQSGFAGLVDFVGHAAAEIEDNANGNGYVFGGKGNHLLLDVVFKDAKVVRVQSGDESIERIGDGYVHQGEIHIGADDLAGTQRNRRRVVRDFRQLGRRWNRSVTVRRVGFLGAEQARMSEKQQESAESKGLDIGRYAKLAPIAFHGFSILPLRREGRADASS